MVAKVAGRFLRRNLKLLEVAVRSEAPESSHNKFRKKVAVKNCGFIGVLKGSIVCIAHASPWKAVGSARRYSKRLLRIRYGL